MTSTVKANNFQIGQSLTATQNATWYQPSTPDGTVRLGIGNAGATTSDVVTVNSSGNLGLGVTPSAWWSGVSALQVRGAALLSSGNTSSNTANAYLDSTTTWRYINSSYATHYEQTVGTHKWYNAPSGTAGNAISFTQAMTLDASGNLLVGTTSSTASPAKGCQLAGTGNGAIAIGHDTGALSGYYYASFAYNGSVIGSITQNGTTAVAYNTSSDERLKENIADAPSAINSVNSIKVRSFDWKADGSHVDYGYIAQELLEIVPEAVSVSPDADQMMGVDFGKLTPRLVKAIQELSAQVTTLQAEINALKA